MDKGENSKSEIQKSGSSIFAGFRAKAKKALFITGLYLVLILVITFPLVLNLKSSVIGSLFEGRGDLLNTAHIYWWTAKQVEFAAMDTVPNPAAFLMEVRRIPFKMGVWNILDGLLLSLPLQKLFSFPLYYNLEIILILLLNAVAGYLFVRGMGAGEYPSFAAGFIAAVNPFTLREISLGRPIQGATFFISLFIFFLYRTLREENPKNAFITAFVWLLGGLWYWFNLIFFGFMALIVSVFYYVGKRRKPAFSTVVIIILVLVLGVTLTAGDQFLTLVKNPETNSGTAFLPFPSHQELMEKGIPHFDAMSPLDPTLIAARSLPLFSPFRPDGLFPLFLFPLVIVLLFIRKTEKDGALLAAGLFFFVLSLGPFLKIGAKVLDFPLPYRVLYHYLPFFSRFYFPYHLVPYALIPLLGFAFKGIESLNVMKKGKVYVSTALIVILTLSAAELPLKGYVPVKISLVKVSSFYTQAEKLPSGGFVELPYPEAKMGITDFYQIFHNRLVLDNRVIYSPWFGREKLNHLVDVEKRRKNGFLEFVKSVRDGQPPADFSEDDTSRIRELGFNMVVLHKYLMDNRERPFKNYDKIRNHLEKRLGKPAYEDEYLTVFKLEGIRRKL